MSLSPGLIADRGDLESERFDMIVIEPCDLIYSIVLAGDRQNSASIKRVARRMYWFYRKNVAEGDHVVLYTKSGVDTSRTREDGKQDHFFYCGFTEPMFSDPNSVAILLSLNGWAINQTQEAPSEAPTRVPVPPEAATNP